MPCRPNASEKVKKRETCAFCERTCKELRLIKSPPELPREVERNRGNTRIVPEGHMLVKGFREETLERLPYSRQPPVFKRVNRFPEERRTTIRAHRKNTVE